MAIRPQFGVQRRNVQLLGDEENLRFEVALQFPDRSAGRASFQQQGAPRLVVGGIPIAILKKAELLQVGLLGVRSVKDSAAFVTQGLAWGKSRCDPEGKPVPGFSGVLVDVYQNNMHTYQY